MVEGGVIIRAWHRATSGVMGAFCVLLEVAVTQRVYSSVHPRAPRLTLPPVALARLAASVGSRCLPCSANHFSDILPLL